MFSTTKETLLTRWKLIIGSFACSRVCASSGNNRVRSWHGNITGLIKRYYGRMSCPWGGGDGPRRGLSAIMWRYNVTITLSTSFMGYRPNCQIWSHQPDRYISECNRYFQSCAAVAVVRPRRQLCPPALTLIVSCLGSFQVVVRLLWSTKKGHPVCGSILTSQPSGRGTLSLLAIVTIGGCVFRPFMLLLLPTTETFYTGDGRFKDAFKWRGKWAGSFSK